VESVAQAGRRLGAFYNQAAEAKQRLGTAIGGAVRDAGDAAVAYEDHRQISNGAAAGAKLFADLDKQWNDTLKANPDPRDTSIKGQFTDGMLGPALDNFSSQFTTQKSQQWAEHFVDATRQHFGGYVSACRRCCCRHDG
jgi:hypothetical protein